MKRFMPPFVCLAITVVMFLCLYNNLNNGTLILAVLILINLAIIFIPSRQRPYLSMVSEAKPVCVCIVCVLATILAIETFFPFALPKEYSQILDLTKHPRLHGPSGTAASSLIFSNEDQRLADNLNAGAATPDSSKSWHVPGKAFIYYGYEPNLKTSYVNEFRWNSLGYFDHDYHLEKPPGTERILVIGDSYVEAVQVPLKRTFHKLLETSLNRGDSGTNKKKVEVIALGNSGTGQVEHFKVLQSKAFAYNPDVVIVTLCSNDFCDDDPELSAELILASGEIRPFVRGLIRHGYYALAFAVRRSEDLRRNRMGISPELLQWSGIGIPRIETAWDRTLDQIRASRDLCRRRGILFILVYLGSDLEVKYFLDPDRTISRLNAMGGSHGNVSWDLTRPINRVRSYCEAHDIPMISLLEPLIAAQKETGKQVFGDHYTVFGHEVAASVLDCAIHLLNSGGHIRFFQPCLSGESRRRVVPEKLVTDPPVASPRNRLSEPDH
jgi:hypothetical protein